MSGPVLLALRHGASADASAEAEGPALWLGLAALAGAALTVALVRRRKAGNPYL